jgi:hypothetical protein
MVPKIPKLNAASTYLTKALYDQTEKILKVS